MKLKYITRFVILLCCIVFVNGACSSDNDNTQEETKQKSTPCTLEITSTQDYTVTEILQSAISIATRADMLTLIGKITSKPSELGLTTVSSDVVKYKCAGINSDSLYLSGKIYIPNQKVPLRGIFIVNHYTITQDSQAPSQSFQLEAVISLLGYAVVMSDYIGFGITKDLPQTYLCADATAQASVDLALNTYRYLKNKGYQFESSQNKVYNMGYSQGGGVTLAVQKMIESKYPNDFQLVKSFAGAGPYDIIATYNEMIEKDYSPIAAVPALVLIGMNYVEKLNLDFSKIFQKKLLDNYQDWINSKKYTTSQITGLIGTRKVSEMLTSTACNPNAAEMKSFQAAMKKNSLIDWIPKAPIFLYHSSADDVVPQVNSINAYNSFKKNSSATITTDFADHGGHSNAGPAFYITVLNEVY